MGNKLLSIVTATVMLLSVVPAFAAEYLPGGQQIFENFESDGDYQDSAYAIGKAKTVKATAGSTVTFAQSFDGVIVYQGSNTATGTSYDYTTEGPNAQLVIDYDIYFDNFVANGEDFVMRLYDADEFAKTFPVSMTFSGAGTITVPGVDTFSYAFRDHQWYRVRHVITATNSAGTVSRKHALYINGEEIFSGGAFSSTNAYKFPKLDYIQLMVSAANGEYTTAYLDNFSVYKANSSAEMLIDRGGVLAEIRSAENMLKQAVFGTGAEEYSPELENIMKEAIAAAKACNTAAETAEELTAATRQLQSVCETAFVPNGAEIEVGEPAFSKSGNQLNAEIPVSLSRYATQSGVPISAYIIAVSVNEDGVEMVDALSEPVEEILLPDEAKQVRVSYTLTPTLDVSETASEATWKLIAIESLETLVPYYPYHELTEPCGNVSVTQKNLYDNDRSSMVFTTESVAGDNLVIAVYDNGSLVYLNQCVAGEDGLCDFYVDITSITQETTLEYDIYSTAAGKKISGGGTFYPVSLINSVLSDIHNLEEDAAADALVQNSTMLGLNTGILELYSTNKLVSAEALAEVRKKLYVAEELEALRAILAEYSQKYAINYLQTDALLEEILDENQKNSVTALIGIGSDADTYGEATAARYVSYLDMESTEKQAVYALIRTRQDYQPEEQKQALESAVVLAQVNTALSNDKIISTISNNGDLLSNAAAFLALGGSKQRTAASTILNYDGDFSSLTGLNNYIATAAEAAEESGGSSGGSGGGFGGGFGGNVSSGTASVATPAGTIETVENEITEINTDAVRFTDIENHAWAKEAIDFLTQKGVLNGKGDNLFAPDDMVTREEFVKMVTLLFDIKSDSNSCIFEDVSQEAWYRPYVISAYENGVINGVSETLFGTGQCLTREQMVTIAYQAAIKAGMSFSKDIYYVPFDDTDVVEAYAKDALRILAGNGIVNGNGENMFMPKESCTRAEAAKVLYGVYIVNYR